MKKATPDSKNFSEGILKASVWTAFAVGLGALVIAARPAAVRAWEARNEEKIRPIFESVLPVFQNEPWKEKVWSRGTTYYIARNVSARPSDLSQDFPSDVAGIALVIRGSSQAKDPTSVLVGLDPQGELHGFFILESPERRDILERLRQDPGFKEQAMRLGSLDPDDVSLQKVDFRVRGVARLLNQAVAAFASERDILKSRIQTS
jgi:hypothetical protein